MNYYLYIFDMDGTILNTLDDLTSSINYALQACGFPVHTKDEVCSYVGNGLMKLVERSVPAGLPDSDRERVYRSFTTYYKIHCKDRTRPYTGIPEVLCSLRLAGAKTAVVSNKADFAVQELCEEFFSGLFDVTAGEKQGIRRKPAPDAVNYVLQKLGIEKEKAVYIGDSEVDIKTAQNAGIDGISVAWGFRKVEFLKEKGAKTFAMEPSDLLRF